jgi:hypothetical protein
MEPIHWQVVSSSPYCLAASIMMLCEVLSKAPSVYRKAPSVISFFSHCFFYMCNYIVQCSFSGHAHSLSSACYEGTGMNEFVSFEASCILSFGNMST